MQTRKNDSQSSAKTASERLSVSMNAPERMSRLALFMWILGVVSYGIAVINRSSFAALGPTAQDYFAVDATVLSSFAVMQILLYTAMQIPVGIFVQRFGPARVIVSGAMLMFFGQTLLALADSVWLVIIARVLVGIGDACTFVSVLRLQAHWFPLRQLPVWTQLTAQVGQAGQIVSVIPLAFLVATLGWVWGFLSIAAATFLVGLLAFLFLRDSPQRMSVAHSWLQRGSQDGLARTDTGTVRTSSLLGNLTTQIRVIPDLMRHPGVRLSFWIHFTAPFASGMFILLWGFPYLTGGVGFTRGEAQALLTFAVVVSIAVGLVLGPLSARFFRHRVHMVIGIVLAMMVTWLAALVWPGGPPSWLVVSAVAVVAAGGPFGMVAFDVLREYSPPRQISVATGFVNTGGFISGLVIIFVIGLLLDLQDAGTTATYTLTAFNWAMASQYLAWGVGLGLILREFRLVRSSNATETVRA